VIVQPLNVATPLDAALGFAAQPLSVAVPPVTVIVTLLESVVTVLPY
jgi:hypothetical protein